LSRVAAHRRMGSDSRPCGDRILGGPRFVVAVYSDVDVTEGVHAETE
jgi:hypothetical protein